MQYKAVFGKALSRFNFKKLPQLSGILAVACDYPSGGTIRKAQGPREDLE